MSFSALLKTETLVGKSGDVPVSSLEGKHVFLYFSAHWCPPCRGFTPKLGEFYNHLPKDKAEVVFISSDRDQAAFDEYFAEMPFLALPYSKRVEKDALSKKFKVQGIPTLVLLDSNGDVVTTSARDCVMRDPEAKDFPWPELNAGVLDILEGAELKTKSGSLTVADLRKPDTYFALYFSAHWCPPCRGFTPQFAQVYKDVVAAGKPLSVIFVSWDKSSSEFDEYYAEMPWAALPHGDARVDKLNSRFEIDGIPSVLLFDHKGTLVNPKARGMISGDEPVASFPWIPKPMGKITEMRPDDEVIERLNSGIIIALYQYNFPPKQPYCGKNYAENGGCDCGHCDGNCGPTNGCPCPDCKAAFAALPPPPTPDAATVASALQAFQDAADSMPASEDYIFMTVTSGNVDFITHVAKFVSLDVTAAPAVVALTVSGGRISKTMSGAVTKDRIVAFAKDFIASQSE